jgi:hypothetical protein
MTMKRIPFLPILLQATTAAAAPSQLAEHMGRVLG